MDVRVYGTMRQNVEIDPIEVLEQLIRGEIGINSWVFKEDGEYYRGYELYAGPHSIDKSEKITKEKYDFIRSLEYSIDYLKGEK